MLYCDVSYVIYIRRLRDSRSRNASSQFSMPILLYVGGLRKLDFYVFFSVWEILYLICIWRLPRFWIHEFRIGLMIFLIDIAQSCWNHVITLFPLRLPNNNIFLLSWHNLINGLVQENYFCWLHEIILRREPDGAFYLRYFALSAMYLLLSGLRSFFFTLVIDSNLRDGFITFIIDLAL